MGVRPVVDLVVLWLVLVGSPVVDRGMVVESEVDSVVGLAVVKRSCGIPAVCFVPTVVALFVVVLDCIVTNFVGRSVVRLVLAVVGFRVVVTIDVVLRFVAASVVCFVSVVDFTCKVPLFVCDDIVDVVDTVVFGSSVVSLTCAATVVPCAVIFSAVIGF